MNVKRYNCSNTLDYRTLSITDEVLKWVRLK